jgi:hypothetical protein
MPFEYPRPSKPKPGKHWTIVTADRAAFDGLASAQTLTIRGDISTTIPARDAVAAFAEITRCQSRLFDSWGIDSQRYGFGESVPSPLGETSSAWFVEEDYPEAARTAHLGGNVLMILDVGDDGLVKACRIAQTAGPDLDAASCRAAMLRGRFNPARDGQGRAVPSWAILPVTWVP